MPQKKKEKLVDLREKMLRDNSLPLKKGATNLVFGNGNPESEILFIGEGPGYWEDMKGIPFVGNAGALLNYLLAQIGIKREDVFVTNVVHYRPPENRDPLPEELDAFKPYLDEIISIIDPTVIITLGRFSMAKFLPNVTISSVHGKPKTVNFLGKELLVIPMYHPAAGLRNGSIKTQMIEDFKKITDIIGEYKNKKTEILKNPSAGSGQAKEIKVEQMGLI